MAEIIQVHFSQLEGEYSVVCRIVVQCVFFLDEILHQKETHSTTILHTAEYSPSSCVSGS